MLKHQGRGLYKVLSMLLVAVILFTSPLGITQAYALNGKASTPGELYNALTLAGNGDTVQLTKDIVCNENTLKANAVIKIEGKNITLDMNGYDLEINNTGDGVGLGLESLATEPNATQLHVIGSGNVFCFGEKHSN